MISEILLLQTIERQWNNSNKGEFMSIEESNYYKVIEVLSNRNPRTELESYLLRNLKANTIATIERRFEEDPDMRTLYYQIEAVV